MRRLISTLLFSLLLTATAVAAEKRTVCAKYMTDHGWSNGYKVQATLITGSELNSATRSFNYNVLSSYVVIFWDVGEASILELDFPYLSAMGQSAKDQQVGNGKFQRLASASKKINTVVYS
jgi:hypothetical protein